MPEGCQGESPEGVQAARVWMLALKGAETNTGETLEISPVTFGL